MCNTGINQRLNDRTLVMEKPPCDLNDKEIQARTSIQKSKQISMHLKVKGKRSLIYQ